MALWLGATLALAGVAFMGIAALAPTLFGAMQLPAEYVGWFSGIVWTFALLASPLGGTFSQHHDPWRVSQACLVLCALGLLAISAGQPWLFWLGAVLIGLGHGLEAPPASQLLMNHTDPKRRPLMFSLKQSGVQLGAMSASLMLPLLTVQWGAMATLVGVASLLLLFAVAMNHARSRYPAAVTASPSTSGEMWREVRTGLTQWIPQLRRQPAILRLALAAGAFGATQVCMNSFMVTWLVKARAMELPEAGFHAALMQGAGLLARPLWGWVASSTWTPRAVLAVLGIAMAICALVLSVSGSHLPGIALQLVLIAFGLSASGWNGVFMADVAQRSPQGEAGRYTAAAVMPLLLGLICGPIVFTMLAAASGAFSLSWGALALSGVVGVLCLPGPMRGSK